MLGLHDRKNATQILRRPGELVEFCTIWIATLIDDTVDKWIELEERRRICWAAVFFDRYVHVGLRFRPLFVSKLPADTILPADDASWDAGVTTPPSPGTGS